MQDEYIIVFGSTNLGVRVAEFLGELGADVLIVSDDERALRHACCRGIRSLHADFKDPGLLPGLDLARARAVVLCLEDEKANLRFALCSVEINPLLNIVIPGPVGSCYRARMIIVLWEVLKQSVICRC